MAANDGNLQTGRGNGSRIQLELLGLVRKRNIGQLTYIGIAERVGHLVLDIEDRILDGNADYLLILPILVLLAQLFEDSGIFEIVLVVDLASVLDRVFEDERDQLVPVISEFAFGLLVLLLSRSDVLDLLDDDGLAIRSLFLELDRTLNLLENNVA